LDKVLGVLGREAGMGRKPISWTAAVLVFFWMGAVTFALSIAFFATWRQQAASIHSEFWQFVFPADLIAVAAFVIGGRLIVNRAWTKRRCVPREAPSGF
jgi:uncharacterized integral membrane protein